MTKSPSLHHGPVGNFFSSLYASGPALSTYSTWEVISSVRRTSSAFRIPVPSKVSLTSGTMHSKRYPVGVGTTLAFTASGACRSG